MAKSAIEKALEKQNKANEKAEREAKNRQIAASIIEGQPVLYGVRILDPDSEKMLDAILSQYDGNENNHVGFRGDNLPRSLHDSIAIQYEKLKMYGLISSCIPYGNGAIITISDTAKTYKNRKEKAVSKQKEEQERRQKLETDYLKIQGMSVEQLREIYLQAVVANQTLQQSLALQEKQLQVLKDLFTSGEDGVAVQKEIMQMVIDQENNKHPIRDYLKDKGGDLGVAAITAATPLVWSGIKAWLATQGIIIP